MNDQLIGLHTCDKYVFWRVLFGSALLIVLAVNLLCKQVYCSKDNHTTRHFFVFNQMSWEKAQIHVEFYTPNVLVSDFRFLCEWSFMIKPIKFDLTSVKYRWNIKTNLFRWTQRVVYSNSFCTVVESWRQVFTTVPFHFGLFLVCQSSRRSISCAFFRVESSTSRQEATNPSSYWRQRLGVAVI